MNIWLAVALTLEWASGSLGLAGPHPQSVNSSWASWGTAVFTSPRGRWWLEKTDFWKSWGWLSHWWARIPEQVTQSLRSQLCLCNMETTLEIMVQVPERVRCNGWKHLLSTGPGPQVMSFLDVTYERFFGWSPGGSSLMFKQLVVEGMGMSLAPWTPLLGFLEQGN